MKARKFIKTIPMKLYIILAAIVLISFFSNDFDLVDIQKTAIILAAGIDKAEKGYAVTAQIAVPKGSDRTTGGTSSVEIDAEGETVSDCFSLIYSKTGWVPKLVFCNLVVIGEEAAKEDTFDILNYFVRDEYMPDSCYVAVCEGKAGELISSQSAIDDASSLAITQIFSSAAVKSGNVMPNTLKEFALSYYGVSKSGHLPYIRSMDQEGDQSAESGSSGSSGGSGGSGSEESQKIYSAKETALFREGKMVGLLTREETFAYSLLKGKVFAGHFNAKDGDAPVTLTVLKDEGGVKLDMKEGPKAQFSVQLTVRLCCRSESSAIEDVASDSVSPEIIADAENTLRGYCEDLFAACQEAGCDLFQLKRSLYRSSLKKYAIWKDNFLPSLRAEFKTTIQSKG